MINLFLFVNIFLLNTCLIYGVEETCKLEPNVDSHCKQFRCPISKCGSFPSADNLTYICAEHTDPERKLGCQVMDVNKAQNEVRPCDESHPFICFDSQNKFQIYADENRTWTDAVQTCESRQMHIARVNVTSFNYTGNFVFWTGTFYGLVSDNDVNKIKNEVRPCDESHPFICFDSQNNLQIYADENRTWTDAVQTCESRQMHIARVHVTSFSYTGNFVFWTGTFYGLESDNGTDVSKYKVNSDIAHSSLAIYTKCALQSKGHETSISSICPLYPSTIHKGSVTSPNVIMDTTGIVSASSSDVQSSEKGTTFTSVTCTVEPVATYPISMTTTESTVEPSNASVITESLSVTTSQKVTNTSDSVTTSTKFTQTSRSVTTSPKNTTTAVSATTSTKITDAVITSTNGTYATNILGPVLGGAGTFVVIVIISVVIVCLIRNCRRDGRSKPKVPCELQDVSTSEENRYQKNPFVADNTVTSTVNSTEDNRQYDSVITGSEQTSGYEMYHPSAETQENTYEELNRILK